MAKPCGHGKRTDEECHECDAYHYENDQWITWGMIKLAVRNPNVKSYMEHWEARALEAEKALQQERGRILQWVKERLRDYQSLPEYGATSREMYVEAKGRVNQLKELECYLSQRPWNSFDAARSTAYTPVDVYDLIYPKSENLDQRVHNAQVVEAYTRGQISITKYRKSASCNHVWQEYESGNRCIYCGMPS